MSLASPQTIFTRNKQQSQTSKVIVCGEGNIKYIYVNPKGEVWGKASVQVLIMSELSDSEA